MNFIGSNFLGIGNGEMGYICQVSILPCEVFFYGQEKKNEAS